MKDYQYHTPLYKDLLSIVVPLRSAYRMEKDLLAKKEMAKTEITAWTGYMDARKNEIDQLDAEREEKENDLDYYEAHTDTRLYFSHKIKDGDYAKIKEWFDRFKDRKTYKMPAEKMTQFHGEYSKRFEFRVPIHPKNLSQLVHPFHGYLTAFEGESFSFKELTGIYDDMIASSYEKTYGYDFLGEELSALTFWKIADKENKGYLTLAEARPLMVALKFTNMLKNHQGHAVKPLTVKGLNQEFSFNLKHKQGEISNKHAIIRFDFIRDIFLERGL